MARKCRRGIWLTLGALGRTGRSRVTATAGLTAVALWTEPVPHGLGLGQIELLLMALIVWDLCQPDRRWWKGAGIGLAAGIKLTPLVFIPYLVLSGKLRQAAVASAAFAGTVAAGFAFLTGASGRWWWTGYFLQAGKVGDAAWLVNQSLFAMVARADGSVRQATPAWLAVAAVVAAVGLTAAAVLYRSGQPVAGWVTCTLTGVLVSPISWDHHWVWIVPVLVVLAEAAQRARGAARWVQAAAAVEVAVVFGRLALAVDRAARLRAARASRVLPRPVRAEPEIPPARAPDNRLEPVCDRRPGDARGSRGRSGACGGP